ncbi:TetR/AcrR family transcriptional regulator [Nocardioides sp.]|uniref:TetR/AcrR family transcriptional regulator n=1 Tax=Nocardioides sp. TaxID=35761 RepID=UPI0039E65F2F
MAKQAPVGRQAEITRAAAALFNERGFHTSSMEDVAQAVGLKKPTLYHYVQSKAQIVAWIHDECVAAVLPPLQGYVKEGLPAPEILRRVAQDIFGLLESKPGYLRIYFENHRDLDKRSQTRIAKRRDEYYGYVRQVLEEGTAAGDLSVENPQLAAMTFFGMCNWAYQWYRPGGSLTPEQIATYVWKTFMAGVSEPGFERLPERLA